MRHTLVQSMRVMVITMLVILCIFTLVDIVIYPGLFWPLFVANAVSIGTLLANLLVSYTRWGQGVRIELASILAITIPLASALYKTYIIQASFIPFAALLVIVASTMLPWRMRYQVIVVAQCIITFVANAIILKVASPSLALATSAGISFSLVSLLLLYYNNERRFALWQVRTALQEERERFRQLGEEAEEMRRAAEAANRAKSTFLANMSHELRTPLNAILGHAQLMRRDAHVTPTQREYLETIARSGEHLLGLINDVLTMSKIEAGRTTLQENAFDLHQQLHSLQGMFQLRAADKGLTLRLDVAPEVPRYIHADEGKLRQVLMNLLSNAVKFTEGGSVTLRVKAQKPKPKAHTQWVAPSSKSKPDESLGFGVGAAPCGWALEFEVEDTGIGIAPAEMDALFAPFVQTASGQQSQGGTGLGLPISRQFVELMGGELDATSTLGQGTTFRVRIPVSVADADAVQALVWQPQRRVVGIEPGQTAPDGGPFRILVVEDQATNRELLLNLLAPFGFDLRAAANGAEGVELWETWQPHLVWMDMRMPVLDGYEATRQIKARAAVTGRPAIVVALTASAFEEDRTAILAAGCDDLVRKPFREGEILDALYRHLGVRFIYETTTPAPETPTSVSLKDLRAAVGTLSTAWATDLYQATIALDIDQMLALVEAVRPQAPHLSDMLAQWIHDFEYEKLMALITPEAAPRA